MILTPKLKIMDTAEKETRASSARISRENDGIKRPKEIKPSSGSTHKATVVGVRLKSVSRPPNTQLPVFCSDLLWRF